MKEKATYRRFDPVAVLAILGCAVMFLFEAFFVFELYDRLEWGGKELFREKLVLLSGQGDRAE